LPQWIRDELVLINIKNESQNNLKIKKEKENNKNQKPIKGNTRD
jgi:hypothetical protein